MRHPQGGFLLEAATVSRILDFFMPSESLSTAVMQLVTQYPDGRMSPFGSVPHSRRSWVHTDMLSCSPAGEITGKISLGPELCLLEGGAPPLTLSKAFPWALWSFSFGNLDLTKVPLYVGDCLRWCSPGAHRLWPRGARAGSWATSGSIGTKVCIPITGHMGG